jgi:hypothetical protein
MSSKFTEISINETFRNVFRNFDQSYIALNKSKNASFEIFYLPVVIVSYVELVISIKYENKSIDVLTDLIVNAFINKYRDCILFDKYLSTQKLYEYDFICELKSFESFKNETNDMTNSIQFSFKSEAKFKLKIEGITVYKLRKDCGTPDTPLHARYEIRDDIIYYYPLDDKKYKIVGDNTIKCLFEGNWDKDIPVLEPIVQCSTEHLDLNSSYFKRVEFENFEYLNETEVAVVDSRIKYWCQNYQNSSLIYILVCNEDGQWIGDKNKCYNTSNYKNL